MSSRQHIRTLAIAVTGGALLALLLATVVTAADRTDHSFGGRGVAALSVSELAQKRDVAPVVLDLVAAPGGGMVAALGDNSGHAGYTAAARLRPDGSLDQSFGEGGFAEAAGLRGGVVTGLHNGQAQAVAIQPDGKVVLAGYRTGPSAGGAAAPVLVRFRADGTLDESFGDGGRVAPQTKGAHDEALHGVAIQPGGRIIGVGAQREHVKGNPAALVIGYRSDGSIDPNFGHGGRLIFPAKRGEEQYTGFRSVKALPSGKLLVSGYRQGRLFLVRLTRAGRLDDSFGGGDGEVSIDIGESAGCSGDCGLTSPLVIAPGGAIIAAGNRSFGSFDLVRLSRDGQLDPGFGNGGIVHSARLIQANDLALDGHGHIVVAGIGEKDVSRVDIRSVFTTLRYHPDGRLDRSFARGGAKVLAAREASAAFAALTQPSGRVVVAGGAQYPSGGHRLIFTRYLDR